MAIPTRSSFRISWQETVARRGPGRKTRQLGIQTFALGQMADLMLRAEELVSQGYEVHILPPTQPIDTRAEQVEELASAAVIPITPL
jgi:hypothetical protein